MLRLLRGNKSFTRWCRRLLEAQYLLLSLLLIGRVILIVFDAFQILIGWLIYCLGGFKQLAPNISIAHLFLSSVRVRVFAHVRRQRSKQVVCVPSVGLFVSSVARLLRQSPLPRLVFIQ